MDSSAISYTGNWWISELSCRTYSTPTWKCLEKKIPQQYQKSLKSFKKSQNALRNSSKSTEITKKSIKKSKNHTDVAQKAKME